LPWKCRAIALDFPVFREIAGERFTKVSPIDGEGWLKTIELFAQHRPSPPNFPAMPAAPGRFFHAIEELVGLL
jgi:hypothetical protein